MKRYLIVGSGLIGRLLAWHLCRAGHQLDILSSDERQGTGSAAYIAEALNPAKMADAFVQAINAGRLAYEAGVMPKRHNAKLSTPTLDQPIWQQYD